MSMFACNYPQPLMTKRNARADWHTQLVDPTQALQPHGAARARAPAPGLTASGDWCRRQRTCGGGSSSSHADRAGRNLNSGESCGSPFGPRSNGRDARLAWRHCATRTMASRMCALAPRSLSKAKRLPAPSARRGFTPCSSGYCGGGGGWRRRTARCLGAGVAPNATIPLHHAPGSRRAPPREGVGWTQRRDVAVAREVGEALANHPERP